MKKIYFISALACLLVLTGCTKNYKTVDEYSNAMKIVKDGNSSYTIEAKQNIGNIELYYKSYIKGDKWKTETSMNGGRSYMFTTQYDGVDLLTYSQGSPYATINPAMDMIKDEDSETKSMTINSQNPVYPLFNWKNGFYIFSMMETETPVFLNNKDNKNGFECRLIKFSDEREACISDKYGIAVYQKIIADDIKHPGQKQKTTINLVKIDTSDIDDSTFELPSGVKKMDMDAMLDNISKMFKI